MIIIYYKRVYKDNHTWYSYRPFPNEEFTVQSKVRLGRKKEDLPCVGRCWKTTPDKGHCCCQQQQQPSVTSQSSLVAAEAGRAVTAS